MKRTAGVLVALIAVLTAGFLGVWLSGSPTRAEHIAGAGYVGTVAGGGTVRFVVSADGSSVTAFTLAAPGVAVSHAGGIAIEDHRFTLNLLGGISLTGMFQSGGRASGILTTASGSFVWTATAQADSSPTETLPIAAQLGDCAGRVTAVWGHDNQTKQFVSYSPDAPAASDLTEMVAGGAYWVYVSGDCNLITPTTVHSLYAGWNLIGWVD